MPKILLVVCLSSYNKFSNRKKKNPHLKNFSAFGSIREFQKDVIFLNEVSHLKGQQPSSLLVHDMFYVH